MLLLPLLSITMRFIFNNKVNFAFSFVPCLFDYHFCLMLYMKYQKHVQPIITLSVILVDIFMFLN
jgi:hypothetical protein